MAYRSDVRIATTTHGFDVFMSEFETEMGDARDDYSRTFSDWVDNMTIGHSTPTEVVFGWDQEAWNEDSSAVIAVKAALEAVAETEPVEFARVGEDVGDVELGSDGPREGATSLTHHLSTCTRIEVIGPPHTADVALDERVLLDTEALDARLRESGYVMDALVDDDDDDPEVALEVARDIVLEHAVRRRDLMARLLREHLFDDCEMAGRMADAIDDAVHDFVSKESTLLRGLVMLRRNCQKAQREETPADE